MPRKLREAASREGMRATSVWLPERVHYALARIRLEEGIAINEAIREAVLEWLAQRKRWRRGRGTGKP
jgi:hypothetical protein